MGDAIGQSLPIAVGVLVSPMPVAAVMLMLLSARALSDATAFLIGWVLGIAAVGGLVTALAGAATTQDGAQPTWLAYVQLGLGALLLVLAVRTWAGRPRAGQTPQTPGWMHAVESFTPVKAFGLAVLLGAVNPKNLLLVVAGATTIVGATSSTSAQIVALAVFVVVASLGVAAPVAIYVAAGDRAGAVLEELKSWIVQHNAAIMAALLLVIGAKQVGDGIAGF